MSDAEDDETPAKIRKSINPPGDEKPKLFVILENANLRTVKVGKKFELLTQENSHILVKAKKDAQHCRPDITHQCLMMLLDSPLNRHGRLQIYVHTINNVLIEISPQCHIPRSFNRFSGLMVQLLHRLYIKAAGSGGGKLLKVIRNPVTDHLPPGCMKIGTSYSSTNPPVKASTLPSHKHVALVIGAMAKGKVDVDYVENEVSISNCPLSAALVCAKICTAFEENWNIL